jgi:hypothetical protein
VPVIHPRPFRFVFQDESGDVARTDRNFIVGLLLVRDIEPIRAAIAMARAEFHFANEMHFFKMSGLRKRVYCAVFEALVGAREEFEFHTILVRREFLELGWFGGRRHLAYNFFTKLLLQRHVERIFEAAMLTDAKTRMREDNFLVYLPSELNLSAGRFVLRSIEAADSKTDDVLQVVHWPQGRGSRGSRAARRV